MGRPGYEEDFKKKLETRDIKPGVDSWSRLEEQLERAGNARRSTRGWWLGVVAACACLLLLLGFLFRSTPDPVLVVEQQEVQPNTQEEIPMQQPLFEDEQNFSESVTATETTLDKENELSDEPLRAEGAPHQESEHSEVSGAAWVQQEKTEVLLAEQLKELGLADLLLEEDVDEDVLWQKLDEVLAQANSLQERSKGVSDAEIDALLLLAAEDISNSRSSQRTVISADALLYEVEMELEESFRQRVFDLLKEGLDKTRTAVVNSMQ